MQRIVGPASVAADVSFGGNYLCQIDVSGSDLRIRPENGRRLAEIGLIAKAQVNEKLAVAHPTRPHIDTINFVTFFHEPERADSLYRCVHVFSDGKNFQTVYAPELAPMGARRRRRTIEGRSSMSRRRPIASRGLVLRHPPIFGMTSHSWRETQGLPLTVIARLDRAIQYPPRFVAGVPSVSHDGPVVTALRPGTRSGIEPGDDGLVEAARSSPRMRGHLENV